MAGIQSSMNLPICKSKTGLRYRWPWVNQSQTDLLLEVGDVLPIVGECVKQLEQVAQILARLVVLDDQEELLPHYGQVLVLCVYEPLVEAQGNLPRFGRLVGHDEIVGEIEQNGDGGLQGVSIRI